MIEVCLRITPPEGLDMQAIVMRAAEAALSHEKAGDAWLSATVVDDAEIHALNFHYEAEDITTFTA